MKRHSWSLARSVILLRIVKCWLSQCNHVLEWSITLQGLEWSSYLLPVTAGERVIGWMFYLFPLSIFRAKTVPWQTNKTISLSLFFFKFQEGFMDFFIFVMLCAGQSCSLAPKLYIYVIFFWKVAHEAFWHSLSSLDSFLTLCPRSCPRIPWYICLLGSKISIRGFGWK